MRILVICQYYYPEPLRVTDLCEELVKKGNEVTVLTDIPNYPMGRIYDGYKKIKYEEINGVKVFRCYTIPRKNNFIHRVLNYYSFMFSSTLKVKKLREEYDVVFVYQLSPVMMGNAAIKYKKIKKTKVVLYCLDIWPESLLVGGIKKNSLIYNHYKKVSKKIYRGSDKILVTSRSFKKYFEENFDIGQENILYLPQYAESFFLPEKCKKNPDGKIDLLFAGNIGKAQSVDTIIEAANLLKDNQNLFWHIVGDGSEYNRIKEKVEELGLKNVIMYGRKPGKEMPKFYSIADAMLVTLQGDSFISQTLPGKVQTYMAAGKPIIGAINGEGNQVIKEAKCGYCGEADNVEELVENVEKFINDKNKEQLAKNAYNYYKMNFRKEIIIDKLLKELK